MSETCRQMAQLMLEADPSELAGRGDSEVARHVGECARCRRMANAFLAGDAALRGALAEVTGRRVRDVRTSAHAVRHWRRWAWGTAAAAAAAAIVVMLRAVRLPEPVTVLPEPRVVASSEPVVRVGSHDPYIVMETRNPKITVVWFY